MQPPAPRPSCQARPDALPLCRPPAQVLQPTALSRSRALRDTLFSAARLPSEGLPASSAIYTADAAFCLLGVCRVAVCERLKVRSCVAHAFGYLVSSVLGLDQKMGRVYRAPQRPVERSRPETEAPIGQLHRLDLVDSLIDELTNIRQGHARICLSCEFSVIEKREVAGHGLLEAAVWILNEYWSADPSCAVGRGPIVSEYEEVPWTNWVSALSATGSPGVTDPVPTSVMNGTAGRTGSSTAEQLSAPLPVAVTDSAVPGAALAAAANDTTASRCCARPADSCCSL